MSFNPLNLFGLGSGSASKSDPYNPAGYNVAKSKNFTPEMMKVYNSLLGEAGSGAQSGLGLLNKLAQGDEATFASLEKPAFSQFEKTLGSIGNRFSHLGAQDSNYFENATAGAGRELAENLQAQRLGLQQNAISQLLGQSNTLLGMSPETSGFVEQKQNPLDMGLESLMSPENIGILLKLLPLLLA